jgi:uncharacterized protein (DUF58 family)
MKITKRFTNWLETRFCAPAYGGWVLGTIAICYFGAAVNTMAGWLYVVSGVSMALLGVSAFLAPRSLSGLSIKRQPIPPVTAGQDLTIEVEIHNSTKRPANLLQTTDILPFVLGKPVNQAIDAILPESSYRWLYYQPTKQRGVYRWHSVELASGAPWGLFWCRRSQEATAKAIVYPAILPLASCPLVDEIGQEESLRGDPRGTPLQMASSGLVRSLRPYRIGDPTRLIHWKTSARYGELRVRELEIVTNGQEIIIALDTSVTWQADQFEQAVIAAASLYFYAQKQKLQVQLWTASTGLVRGDRVILETLAATNPQEESSTLPEKQPLIWLTQNSLTISTLPPGSRWVLWTNNTSSSTDNTLINRDYPGLTLDQEQDLQLQLQKPVTKL